MFCHHELKPHMRRRPSTLGGIGKACLYGHLVQAALTFGAVGALIHEGYVLKTHKAAELHGTVCKPRKDPAECFQMSVP